MTVESHIHIEARAGADAVAEYERDCAELGVTVDADVIALLRAPGVVVTSGSFPHDAAPAAVRNAERAAFRRAARATHSIRRDQRIARCARQRAPRTAGTHLSGSRRSRATPRKTGPPGDDDGPSSDPPESLTASSARRARLQTTNPTRPRAPRWGDYRLAGIARTTEPPSWRSGVRQKRVGALERGADRHGDYTPSRPAFKPTPARNERPS